MGAPVEEAEFEETMIMDATEVKEFLRQDLERPEPAQQPETTGALVKEEPDLVADAARPSAETTPPGELIVDEKDARDEDFIEGRQRYRQSPVRRSPAMMSSV